MSLTATRISHRYRTDGPWILRDVTVALTPGEVVAFMGPSGSGKSTLLSILGLLLRPTMGVVTLDGREGVHERDAARARANQLAWVFQTTNVLGRRSAVDNVALALVARGRSHHTARRDAVGALGRVGLDRQAWQQARTLSGGELQRVCIARALIARPTVVLADEPTAQLDRSNADAVVAALLQLREGRTTVILATHDPLVAQCADRVVELVDGGLLS